MRAARKIEDYALIGDFKTAALVSREGSIDWLCVPRFDSPSCFTALLGDCEDGRWLIQPEKFVRVTRQYRKDTLILETDFFTEDGGQVRLIDCMLPESKDPTLLRVVKGIRGTVKMNLELIMRFDYGSIIPWVTRETFGGLKAIAGPDCIRIRSTEKLYGKDMKTYSSFTVDEGESASFVLLYTPSNVNRISEIGQPSAAIERVDLWWKSWSERCTYKGPYEEAVRRSLITLKALTYEATGGIVAAPTTSLPEEFGGVRNWDYRFCWLRDATITLIALLQTGYKEEAIQWREWLLRAVAGTPSQINIMYGLRGERRLTEYEIPWLSGFADSKPVRVGNAAHGQFQLDVFGGVLECFHLSRVHGMESNGAAWDIQRHIFDFLEGNWQKPDRGIWEVRGPDQHFTHSKVMAWLGMDRGVRAISHFDCKGDAKRWRATADRIHAEICEKGYNSDLESFTQAFGSKTLDASQLIMPIIGFLPASDRRVQNTLKALESKLLKNGFMMRYETSETKDGLPGSEGAFLACSFWYVNNLCMQGRVKEAQEVFERVLSIRNDVGLLAEEYDPSKQRQVGNFPQAFSHVSLIYSAQELLRVTGGGQADLRRAT